MLLNFSGLSLLSRIHWQTKLSTTSVASAIIFSLPIRSRLSNFHHTIGTVCRKTNACSTRSIATANGTLGKSEARHSGSTPRTRVQVVSNMNLMTTSRRSTISSDSAISFERGSSTFDNLLLVRALAYKGLEPQRGHMCQSHPSLLQPRVTVNVEDTTSKNVEYLRELVALRIIREVKIEHVVGVGGAAGYYEVHPAEPGAFEHESVIELSKHGGNVVEEAASVGHDRWDHADDRPIHDDLAAALSHAAKEGDEESGKYC